VLALIRHLGEERVHLVAHDWGGEIAWRLAMNHPKVVRTLSICNLPHPAIFRRAIRRNWRQLARSWYIFFFQLPWLPERLLARDNYRWLARGLIRDCAGGTFTKDDIRTYLAGWRRQGLGGGVNWYRAALRQPQPLPRPVPILRMPVLLAWGERDRALGKELTYGTEEFVANLRLQYLPASHWVQQELPEQVSALILENIARGANDVVP
jgi:pimeloyl-ACP methyl ester carboxylesterase